MKVEVRFSSLDELRDLSGYKFDCIGFGSEECVYKLPTRGKLIEAIEIADKNSKEFRYITPWVPQLHMGEVIDSLIYCKNHGAKIKVTVNDLGVLFKCFQLNLGKFFDLSIGRGIVRLPDACPWFSVVTGIDYGKNDREWKFFKDFDVKGYEYDFFPKRIPILAGVHNFGAQLIVHLGFVTMAVARACYTARFFNLHFPTCVHKCSKPIIVKLSEIYPLRGSPMFRKVNQRTTEHLSNFFIYGNAVLRKIRSKVPKHLINQIDYVVLNKDYHSILDIKNKLEELEK